MQVQHIRIPNSTFYSKILFFRQFIFIIYLSFLSYKYLKNEVQSGISHVQSIIPLFYNIYCILHPDFNGTNTHIPRNQKTKLTHILPSSQSSNAGSRSTCSPGFAACSFGINNIYFVSFIYVTFLNFHNTLPPAPNGNRWQFFLPYRKHNSCKR